MLILTHIALALLSLILSTVAVVSPSRNTLKVSAGLIAATLTSGVYLVWTTHVPLVSSCMTGLIYLSVVFGLQAVAYKRLPN